jgi:hypothetical protein
MFHRYDLPGYFIDGGGDLLADYDLLNDPAHASVGGSGVPAPVDGKKSGGDNDGTYFAAFGEDGRAFFQNRGLAALGENTDLLDDIVQTNVPVVTFQDGTAAGATPSVTLNSGTGWVYVGKSGATNNQATRDRLVHVTDQTGAELEVSGTKVTCSLIHDGASVNVLGTETDGFYEDPVVNFSPSIPNGTTYRIWYGTRSSWAEQALTSKGPLAEVQIFNAQNVTAEVRKLFRLLRNDAGTLAWNANFETSLRALAGAGLNERYRRQTTEPAGFTTGQYNVAGDGATIFRDGKAVTIQTDDFTLTSATNYRDPNAAALKVVGEAARSSSTSSSYTAGGDFGYWHETEWRVKETGSGDQRTRQFSAGPALMEVVPWDVRNDEYLGDDVLTFISPSTATATLNPDSGASANDRATIECASGQFFALSTPTRTAIRLGVDMLEVTLQSGDVATYVIDNLLSATRVIVRLISGAQPSFSASAVTDVALRWLQPIVRIGGVLATDSGAGFLTPAVSLKARPLLVIPPSFNTINPSNELHAQPAFFGSRTGSVTGAAAGSSDSRALEWGSTASPDSGGTVNGTLTARGYLMGDGSLFSTLVRATALNVGNGNATVASNGNAVFNDVVMDSLSADDAVINNLAVNEPEFYTTIDEDWIHFVQEFTPDIIHSDELWEFNEIAGTFTLNNGTPSAKNPGQLEAIGAGGSSSRSLAVYKTTALPYGFSALQMVTVVAKVDDSVGNVSGGFNVGVRDNVTSSVGGNDSLMLAYFCSAKEWRLNHRVGGIDGPQHGTVLGAATDNVFVSFRLLKNAANGIDVYFNGSLAVTVASADLPTGNGTFGLYFSQGSSDADAVTYAVDYCGLRASCGARQGA